MFIWDLYVVILYVSQISGVRLQDHWSWGLHGLVILLYRYAQGNVVIRTCSLYNTVLDPVVKFRSY